MSGAQGKAAIIANCAAIIAEVDASRIKTRLDQGWITGVSDSIPEVIKLAQDAMAKKEGKAYAYRGTLSTFLNISLTMMSMFDLVSDQTSCHNVYDGGYCPQGLTFEERTKMLAEDPKHFRELVDKTLHAHYNALKRITSKGIYFFDYGNLFHESCL